MLQLYDNFAEITLPPGTSLVAVYDSDKTLVGWMYDFEQEPSDFFWEIGRVPGFGKLPVPPTIWMLREQKPPCFVVDNEAVFIQYTDTRKTYLQLSGVVE